MDTAGGVSVENSKLVLSTTVRKKTDTKSEGGSSSSKDKVAGVVGLSSLPDFELGESPSIRLPRVQFAMDQGVGQSSLPDFKLSESPSIRLPEVQVEMDQGDPIPESDSAAIISPRGHKGEGGMDTDCESEGAIGVPEDEAVCRGAEQVEKEADTFDLCGSLSELEIAPQVQIRKGIVLLNVRTKTLYAKSYLIYDSGASVHLIRDLNLFAGEPVRIPDNEVSVVGFNTSYGNALALAKGVLKWPLEGVEAYYSRNCVGNIISEFKLRDTYQIRREEQQDKWRDTVTASRLSPSSDTRDDLVFRRGLEGLLICDVASMILNHNRRQLYTFPTLTDRREYSPRVGSVEGSVPEWLERLGLTAREAQASMALEVFSCDNRERVIIQVMACMNIAPGKREDILGRGSLIKGSGSSIHDREKFADLGKLKETLRQLRDIKPDTMACLSCVSGPDNGGTARTWSGTGSNPSKGDLMDLESVSSESANGAAAGTRHEPVSNLSMKIGGGGAVQSKVGSPEEGNHLTRKNCCVTASSTGSCGYRGRVFDPNPVSGVKVTSCLVGAYSVASLSDQEKFAVLQLCFLNLSIGELMVSWYAVTERLTAESMIVGLTLRQRGLSKKAIDRIALVSRLHQLTSYTSLDGLKSMVQHGLLKGIDESLGALDVDRYQQFVHQLDCACTMGKIRAPTAKCYNYEANHQNACFCDVFQLTTDDKSNKYLFFLGVDIESQFVFVERIQNSSTQELQRAINRIEALYSKYQRKLECLVLDNAGGLSNEDMKKFLGQKGLLPKYSTTGLHVRVAEASVKVVKSLCRTTVLDWATSRKFITTFVPYLVTWVAQSINFSLRSGTEYASPHLRFTGVPISVDVHLRFAFLDTVAFHKTESTSIHNLESKGAIGLVVAREGDAGALTVLNLETMKECKRYHLKLMDGPEVIKYVNSRLSGLEVSAESFAREDTEVADSTVEELEMSNAEFDILKAQLKERIYPHRPIQPAAAVQPAKAKKPTAPVNLQGGGATSDSGVPVLGVLPSHQTKGQRDRTAKHYSQKSRPQEAKSAAYNPVSGRFVDEFEEELREQFVMLSLIWNEPSKPSRKRPKSKDNALRARRGDRAVDEAGKAEIAQMRKKEVMVFQTKEEVASIFDRGLEPVPLIMLNKEKFNSEGLFDKIKARLIALGNLQEAMERAMTEAPTASLQSFYLMILIATKRNIKLLSIDVSGAFLNAKLDEEEEVYVSLPSKLAQLAIQDDVSLRKYLQSNGSLVARLKKCLYGLQQSPQRWFLTIRKVLLKLGFKASEYDPCLFYKMEGEKLNLLLLYVDDMLLMFENPELAGILKDALIAEFEGVTTQEGDIISFLGITITQSESEITLDQQGYIKKMVDSLDLDKVPVYKNPLGTGYSITGDRFLKSREEADPARLKQMKSLSMTLMYLAIRTRRDVLFLSSFFASITCPEEQDIAAVKRAIIYTYNTIGKKQHFYREGDIELTLMGDSSHNFFSNAKGQGCKLVYPDKWSAAIYITSNVHKFVADSAYEAELVVQDSLADVGKLYWSRLNEIGIVCKRPMLMLCDNEAVVTTANRSHITAAARTKFYNTKLFRLFEQVSEKWIDSRWITTKEMDADIGTKPLTGAQYHYLSERQFSRKPGFTHGVTNLDSIVTYDDANEPYFDFVYKGDIGEVEGCEMSE
jgi:hypothetical protein